MLTLRRKASPATSAYLDAWRALCLGLDDCLAARERVRRDPALLRDPWHSAQANWLLVFERELAAAQALYSALEHGAALPDADLEPARDCVSKLASVLVQARERVLLAA